MWLQAYREEMGKAGYTPPAGAAGGFSDGAGEGWGSNPAAATPRAGDVDGDGEGGEEHGRYKAEEGVPPERDTVESLRLKLDEVTLELEKAEDDLDERDDVIEELKEKLRARGTILSPSPLFVHVLTRLVTHIRLIWRRY